jgi:hypothetical protein
MVTYYVALKPGAWRSYSTPEDSFWCCVGTGMENPARYGEAIYARQGDALLVNLFLASELAWPQKGLAVRQETRFPDEGSTRLVLRLERPTRFALRLRHPAWAGDGFAATVNGQAVSPDSQPGSYATVEREWRDGDVVEVRLPMALRFEAFADDPARGAFVFGPIVLAADLGAEGLDARARFGPTAPETHLEDLKPAPVLGATRPAEALARVTPAPGPLAFRMEGLGHPADVTLRPFFRLADRRYAVYFDVLTASARAEREARAAAQARARAAVEERTVDSVQPGSPEAEKGKDLEEKGSDAWSLEGRRCRSARYGGTFTYSLRLPAGGPAALRVAYWGGESRRHVFEVVAEGETIASQSLFDDRPGEVLEVEYPLPERLTRGRDRVRVGFRTGPGTSTGAVFEVRVVRPVSPAP